METDIDMLGFFLEKLKCLGREVLTKIYVAKKGKVILGWRDLTKLGLMLILGSPNPLRVCDVNLASTHDPEQDTLSEMVKIFPDVFTNKMGVIDKFEHRIKLKKMLCLCPTNSDRFPYLSELISESCWTPWLEIR